MQEQESRANLKELPSPQKRGMCIYIQEFFILGQILKDLFNLLEKRKFIFKRKLSQEAKIQIMKEIASYIYFETVKQIWEYGEGNLFEEDAREVLDTISTRFFYTYDIRNLPDKLEEYNKAENPMEHVSRIVLQIIGNEDITKQMEVANELAGWTANPEYNLFDAIKEKLELSEPVMTEIIEDFFDNYYPQFIGKNERG